MLLRISLLLGGGCWFDFFSFSALRALTSCRVAVDPRRVEPIVGNERIRALYYMYPKP